MELWELSRAIPRILSSQLWCAEDTLGSSDSRKIVESIVHSYEDRKTSRPQSNLIFLSKTIQPGLETGKI